MVNCAKLVFLYSGLFTATSQKQVLTMLTLKLALQCPSCSSCLECSLLIKQIIYIAIAIFH